MSKDQQEPRGHEISIYPVTKMQAVLRFGVTVGADRPVGKITGDPHGKR